MISIRLFSRQRLIREATFTKADFQKTSRCRRSYNRLGFAYQLAFVRLANRFIIQQPFEMIEEIVMFTSLQLGINSDEIYQYKKHIDTVSEHQEKIRHYLKLRKFGTTESKLLSQFLMEEACRLEQATLLMGQAKQFLKEKKILYPAESTLTRLISNQRDQARNYIFTRITKQLPSEVLEKLDQLLIVDTGKQSALQRLKQPPGLPSPSAILRLLKRLEYIQSIGILQIDLSWLNNNYQRSLTHYAQRCSADRLRNLSQHHRYAVLICFLWQTYKDVIDFLVDMHDKLITKVYKRAQSDVDDRLNQHRKTVRSSLATFKTFGEIILDGSISDVELRETLFHEVSKEELTEKISAIDSWLEGDYSHVFKAVVLRFSYLRQFSPAFLEHLDFRGENIANASLLKAIELLRNLNRDNKRKLSQDAPLDFISEKLHKFIVSDKGINKSAWECALLTAIRDEIKSGNISIKQSKRFGNFNNFFIAQSKWEARRKEFFNRSGLPEKVKDVPEYLTKRLNQAFDNFLEKLPTNSYAQVDKDGWNLSIDHSPQSSADVETKLAQLRNWLSEHMRTIKLPELLIEVDNDLHFTDHFMPVSQQGRRQAENICAILVTIIAHGCNIGAYTMSRLTEGVGYKRIKYITDWHLTEEAQRNALAKMVNAITNLDVSQFWGDGTTSSSDGQRFTLKRKVLQRTYSPKFNDFAMEFYSFIADNYAPFYSTPIECTDRDAAYVLDGLLYNESDLALEEHYVDTHGYTEINYAAFAMYGRKFSPRIRGIQRQHIYRIDKNKNHGPLSSLVARGDRTIHMDWICDQWDRMGHFYASLESGHATASTALKRLVAFSGKNHFYRANRELGRVFKTEDILSYMSDPIQRQKRRQGLLKGEQLHSLARDVSYAKRGRINTRNLEEQRNSCSCLTLTLACIIYWQAKEINRALNKISPDAIDIDPSLIEHISPIGWDNVLLYGEYVVNKNLIR